MCFNVIITDKISFQQCKSPSIKRLKIRETQLTQRSSTKSKADRWRRLCRNVQRVNSKLQTTHNSCWPLSKSQLWFSNHVSWCLGSLSPMLLPMVDTILAQGCTLAYSSQPSQHFYVVLAIIQKIPFTITIHLNYHDSHISCLHPHQQAASISIFMEVELFLIPILVGLLVASSAYSCGSDGGIHGGRWEVRALFGNCRLNHTLPPAWESLPLP